MQDNIYSSNKPNLQINPVSNLNNILNKKLSQEAFFIEGHELTLKLITEEDLEALRLWRNRENSTLTFLSSKPISKEAQIKWFHSYVQKKDDLMFTIIHNDTNTKIGCLALYDINTLSKSAEFGRIIIGDHSFRGKSFGTIATKLLIDFAFETLNLTTVFLHVFKTNISAIKTYEKVGFKIYKEPIEDFKLIKMYINN